MCVHACVYMCAVVCECVYVRVRVCVFGTWMLSVMKWNVGCMPNASVSDGHWQTSINQWYVYIFALSSSKCVLAMQCTVHCCVKYLRGRKL